MFTLLVVCSIVLELEVDGLVSRKFYASISAQCLSSLFLNALVDSVALDVGGIRQNISAVRKPHESRP